MSLALLTVPRHLTRGRAQTEDDAVQGAVWLIDHLCAKLGLADLGTSSVLDVGCGVRFAQAFVNHRMPVNRYVGVDVSEPLIEFLRTNVSDPRFTFAHLDAQNDLYNPTGEPLTADTDLGIGDERFDLIWLFSVFTHLAPHDYVALLRLLRRHVRPEGRLFFTLFVDELTEGGHGLTDRVARGLPADDPPRWSKRLKSPPFRDADPSRPLLYAVYSRQHALELVEGTGWRVLELAPPNEHAQHQLLCAPE